MDGFRAFAIFSVVGFHLLLVAGALDPGTRFSLIAWGLFGNVIDVFFIISGFVLFLPVVARGGELGSRRSFGLSRAVRLVPAYWLCIALMLLLLSVFSHPTGPTFLREVPSPDPFEIAGNLAALQMPIRLFDGAFAVGFGVNGALWMISIIAGFYVVLAFVARGYFRHPLLGLAIAAAITFGWKQAVLDFPGFFEWLDQSEGPLWAVQLIATDQLPGWSFSFALGMTAAWAYSKLLEGGPVDRFQRLAVVCGVAALAAYGVCAHEYGVQASNASFGAIGGSTARSDPALSIVFSIVRAALLAAIALGPLWVRRPFESTTAARLAELSYGIYLIHLVVVGYLGVVVLGLPEDGTAMAVATWFAVVIPVSAAYAWLSLRYVERPVKRWSERRGDRSRRAQAPIRPSPARP